ncbi:ASKHA domain-containing protein [Planctomycetota bacterium]
MKHFNVNFEPDGKQVSIHAGATLLEAAGLVGIVLNTNCGERGTCEKCAVNLEPSGQRVLSCQYRIQSDLTVTVPETSRFFQQKILTEGVDTQLKGHFDIHEKYHRADQVYGLAIDIGTTTVVAKLIDMSDGSCLSTRAILNPQVRYGDDVISRITYADSDEKLAQLQQVLLGGINELIAGLCSDNAISSAQIYEICAVGNTTMNHLFLKLPVTQLGQAPYEAYCLDAKDTSVEQFPLEINPLGNVHTVENIAGFVGSDTIAAALAVEIDSAEKMTLIIDIGTNGEIVLGSKDKLYAASCAAGPAFEGARISQGSRAVSGAIEAVVINDEDIDLDVIDSVTARSICGSGLIDAVAVLLELGVIDSTGRFVEPEKVKEFLSPKILSRIITYDSQPTFILADNGDDGQVMLTQKDIREVQLAKAAIRTGIKLMQKKLGVEDDGVERILLAGAFGNYIRRESALRIGLTPRVPPECIHFVGNAASSGAQIILLSSQTRDMARKLSRKIEYVEIAHEKDFTSVYADSMMF